MSVKPNGFAKSAALSGGPMHALQVFHLFLLMDFLVSALVFGVAMEFNPFERLEAVIGLLAFQAIWFAAPLLILTSIMLLVAGEWRRAMLGFGVLSLVIGIVTVHDAFAPPMG